MGPHENGSRSEFPAGLRVLVVDDDRICLLILDRLLRECLYRVTTCERAVDALKLLRDNKDGFDLVISDVHMPDMDGYKLLELVGLEMDLPVLMMSSNSETSAVMKGIKHGACDYLLKPVRTEELKNIWQHVIRRKQRDLDIDDQRHKLDEGADSLANDGADGASKSTKKRKDSLEEEDDAEPETEDPATSKKPRVVWSVELRQKFVNAVNSLGIDKAVPKRILELMDVRNLTRENVASHLQKYRLYLKRLSGVAYQGGGSLGAGFFGADERFLPTGAGLLGDFRSQLPTHPLISSLHSGLLDRVSPYSVDPIFLSQLAAIQGMSGKPPFNGAPLLNSANALNCPASSGFDLKHMSAGVGGQVSSHVHNDKLFSPTLSPGSHMERSIGQDNNVLADHKNNTVLMQIPQQQRSRSQMALPETQRSDVWHAESAGPALPKINNSLNALHSSSKPSPEMATIGNFSYEASNGLGPFRKKGVEVRLQNDVQEGEFYTLPSLAQSTSHAIELSGKVELSGLQSILSDQVGPNATFRFGTGLMNWHNQGSTSIGQASNLSYLQEPKMGWTPNFGNDLVDDIDVKPLAATSTVPAFEHGFGERDQVLKAASSELQMMLKVGAIPEPFPPSDDLLTCYMKQQQQDMVSLTKGDATEGYTLGNMYAKYDDDYIHLAKKG